MDGGYYRVDIDSHLTVLGLNTITYDKHQVQQWIGPEAQNQLNWLDKTLAEPNRKFLILSHVYAGSRLKHDPNGKPNDLWRLDYTETYFKMMLKYVDKIVLEVGAHDHWMDLRYFESNSYAPYRPLFVAPGVSMNHDNFPGYSTFEIHNGKPSNLVLRTMDITNTIGKTTLPSFSSICQRDIYSNLTWPIPINTFKFSSVGISGLDAASLKLAYSSLQHKP